MIRHIWMTDSCGRNRKLIFRIYWDGSETPSWLSGAQDLPRFYELIAGRFGADVADDMFFNNAARFFARNEEL